MVSVRLKVHWGYVIKSKLGVSQHQDRVGCRNWHNTHDSSWHKFVMILSRTWLQRCSLDHTHAARSRASVSQIHSLDDQLTWATTGSSDTDNVIFVISSWSPRYDGSRHTVLYHANLRKFWRNAKPRTDWIYTNCHNTVSRYTVTQGRSDVRLDVTFYSQLV